MVEITDEMVEAYLDASCPAWRTWSARIVEEMRQVCQRNLTIAASLIAPVAAAAEREECARIADAVRHMKRHQGEAFFAADDIATAIRARGGQP